jgi:superfamily II DNA or RNA helicase
MAVVARGRRRREAAKLSRQHPPDAVSLEDWQVGLRRQFGREQDFLLENVGPEPLFSDFRVTNPASGRTYRVAVRGAEPGVNFCSCPDFRTNALGTCKHVEFTLARLARTRGARAALRRGIRARYSSVTLRYGARREVCFRRATECPPGLARLAARYFDRDGVLRPHAVATFHVFLTKAARFDHELRCYDDALEFVAEARDAERRRAVLARAFPRGVRSAEFEQLLRTSLYDYQREGAFFAARAGRCLLADDMGLGKTLQALAAGEILARHLGVTRVLVVCPTSLKHQWEREVARFTERCAVVVGGGRAKREDDFATASFYKITSYDTIHRDLDLIGSWSPELVVLDEAQRIKNWSTRTARGVKQIASPYALVLTGTPLENRLEELVSIVQFVDQHRLGPTFRLLHEHQVRDAETGRVVGYRDLDRLGRTLAPILVRRRKAEVLDQLPPRLEKTLFVPMTPEQWRHHEENREVVARLVAKWRRQRFLTEVDQRRLMIALQKMRMACDSTYLLDGRTDFGGKPGELVTILDELFERPEVKVVVFSQWLRMHELLVRRFEARGWGHVLFHGGIEAGRRGGLVDRFRDDPRCRVFLSTDAGGVGLNLQHASVVVNVDIPWNPAVLEQRIGRVHRLGQRRPVQVVNLVAQGSIEEGMLSLLGFKRAVFAGVLDGGDAQVLLGGSRLARFMETVEKTTAALPASSTEPDETAGEGNAEVAADDGPGDAGEGAAGDASFLAVKSADEPLATLVEGGLAILGELARTLRTARGDGRHASQANGPFQLARDPTTGETLLRMRIPDAQLLDRAVQAAARLVQSLHLAR